MSGITIVKIDFSTVFLNINETYKSFIGKKENILLQKRDALLQILSNRNEKTLIYAGNYPETDKVSKILMESINNFGSDKLNAFSAWLIKNYSEDYALARLVKKGVGIHNGRLHRSLSQIQIKLFSESDGIKNIISTSSIIEGVNTSAKNVILWKNKNGRGKLNFFEYKNLIGRGGRMMKHFIGEIYLLEKPPLEEVIALPLEMPKELIDDTGINDFSSSNPNALKEAKGFHAGMRHQLGDRVYNKLSSQSFFKDYDWQLIHKIASDMKNFPREWNGLSHLNGSCYGWDRLLYKILKLVGIAPYKELVNFIKIYSSGWHKTVPSLCKELEISVSKIFELEKKITFRVSSAFDCVNILQKELLPDLDCDISSFVTKSHYAFLPKNVYLLEEYGLPRMISKKIQNSGMINLENDNEKINDIIHEFKKISYKVIVGGVADLDRFDKYFTRYFFDGIE